MSATLEIYTPPVAQAHVRLLSPEPWLASATKVCSGVGADIVMESLHSLSGRERKRLIYKGECQRTILLPRPEVEKNCLTSSPVNDERRLVLGCPWLTFNLFPILVALSSSRGDADRSLKLASLVVVRCQPWIYLRLLA